MLECGCPAQVTAVTRPGHWAPWPAHRLPTLTLALPCYYASFCPPLDPVLNLTHRSTYCLDLRPALSPWYCLLIWTLAGSGHQPWVCSARLLRYCGIGPDLWNLCSASLETPLLHLEPMGPREPLAFVVSRHYDWTCVIRQLVLKSWQPLHASERG